MKFILSCRLGEDVEAKRLALREKHLAYIDAHKSMILFGGPSLTAEGKPHTMTLVVEAADLSAVQRFSREEPYTAAGVFSSVEILQWMQVLPESHAGALQEELAKERARHVAAPTLGSG